jgi:hypothetical protein
VTRSIPTREFALYALAGSVLTGSVITGSGAHALGHRAAPFSAACYSRYKYGSVTATEAFATALAAAFAEHCPDAVRAPRLLLTSSPYSHVPTAATTLARKVQPGLNAMRATLGLPPAPLLKVDRLTASAGDYGTLSALARDRHMAANALSFHRFPPCQVRGAHLVVVDDVRVTGAHQRCLARASEELPLGARAFVYIAAVRPAAGGTFDPASFDPTVEDALNHAAIKTLDDLAGLVDDGDFSWNVRACKFILSPANRAGLPRFLRRMPGWFVRDLHRNSDQDGYARMEHYAQSHAAVRAELDRRDGQPWASRCLA